MNGFYQPYWTQPDENELEHYGILGMKWGVRRYQNKDGTLTAAGKKRYAGDTLEQIERSERRKAKVVKAAKTGAIVAGAAIASGATYYGLTHTAAGKAAVATGIKAISKLIDTASGAGESSKRSDLEWVQSYRSSTSGTGRTVSSKNRKDPIRTTIGNIPVSTIPDVKQDLVKYASPEYWAEYEYNSKKNRF